MYSKPLYDINSGLNDRAQEVAAGPEMPPKTMLFVGKHRPFNNLIEITINEQGARIDVVCEHGTDVAEILDAFQVCSILFWAVFSLQQYA